MLLKQIMKKFLILIGVSLDNSLYLFRGQNQIDTGRINDIAFGILNQELRKLSKGQVGHAKLRGIWAGVFAELRKV